MDTGAPVVPGLTEVAPDGVPLHQRLVDLLSQRPGGAQRKIADGLALLEQAIGEESDERLKNRLAAGISLIRGMSNGDNER